MWSRLEISAVVETIAVKEATEEFAPLRDMVRICSCLHKVSDGKAQLQLNAYCPTHGFLKDLKG